jgi:hypothetical protein
MSEHTLRETCLHEAAHAVVARALGLFVRYIALRPGADPDAAGVIDFGTHRKRGVTKFERAAVYYAGYVAECKLHGEREDHHAHSDINAFNKILSGASDAEHEQVIAFTESQLAAHWSEVEKLAGELERCNGLYTKELEALGYWWPTPVHRNAALMAALHVR